jgi:hypothetical protein
MGDGYWKPKRAKWLWRDFLTEGEAKIIAQYDELAKQRDAVNAKLRKLQPNKAFIANRALQRAKFEAGKRK